MQETHNNCFGSEIRSTTLGQAQTGKYMPKYNLFICCCYIPALVLTCFYPTKGHAMYFQTIVASFLHLMVLFFKVLLNQAIF